MIVACLLDEGLSDVDLDVIDQRVPDCSKIKFELRKPRVFKEHIPKFDVFPRVIYNVRDGRDCVISAFKYAIKSLGYEKDRIHFLLDRNAQVFGLWSEHVSKALEYKAKYPDRILFVRYEDIQLKPIESVLSLAEFLKVDVSVTRVKEILSLTSLDQQRKKNKSSDIRKKHTLGQGRTGGWISELSELELMIFEGLSSLELKKLGYSLSSESDN